MNSITPSKIKNMSPQLLVTDIDRSVEFYKKCLALTWNFDTKISMQAL